MKKEELERIKQAYNSGLKIQIWFDGNWKDFDIREYSMYPEPFSEHRRYRIVGSAYADFAEQRIAELEKENEKLEKEVEKHKWNNIFLEGCADYDKKIAEEYTTLQERIVELKSQIEKMKDCINDLVHLGEFDEDTDEEYTNYLVHEALQNAKQFLYSEFEGGRKWN